VRVRVWSKNSRYSANYEILAQMESKILKCGRRKYGTIMWAGVDSTGSYKGIL
jgi:hypothetical protein